MYSMTWVQSASGKKMDLMDPDPASVDFVDIACHLSHICRFNGATGGLYSVAQHSILVQETVLKILTPPIWEEADGPGTDALLVALLHDAHEAYIGDITTPVANALGAEGKAALAGMKARLDAVIFEAAGLAPGAADGVKIQAVVSLADRVAMDRERAWFLADAPQEWLPGEPSPQERRDYYGRAPRLMTQDEAVESFLDRLEAMLELKRDQNLRGKEASHDQAV